MTRRHRALTLLAAAVASFTARLLYRHHTQPDEGFTGHLTAALVGAVLAMGVAWVVLSMSQRQHAHDEGSPGSGSAATSDPAEWTHGPSSSSTD